MGIPSTLVEALDKKDTDFEKYQGFMAVRNTFLHSYRNNDEYIEVVKELAPSLTKKDIADTLKLSVSTITRICNDNCIKTFGSTWTEFEVDYLIRYYRNFSICQLAKELGRSESAVRSKATKLQLSK